jgi:hypothetical protein
MAFGWIAPAFPDTFNRPPGAGQLNRSLNILFFCTTLSGCMNGGVASSNPAKAHAGPLVSDNIMRMISKAMR